MNYTFSRRAELPRSHYNVFPHFVKGTPFLAGQLQDNEPQMPESGHPLSGIRSS